MEAELAAEAAFLAQANRNNWQMYLASLRSGARNGWDVCVLTASDERQAAMYRRQLEWRREASLLPQGTRFVVIADPDGRRVGSGGATLRVLSMLSSGTRFGSAPGALAHGRVLVIHSGGDSKRLPHCSAVGKLFARVPRDLPDGRASTIFDEFLISLSGLAATVPPGVLIASGDVLVIFDHLQLSLLHGGVTGVAAAAPAAMGLRHGVYVADDSGHRVRAYLHKPAATELARWSAIGTDGTVQIDTGMVWLDAATAERLASLVGEPEVGALCEPDAAPPEAEIGPLNLYGDLLLPLSHSTTHDGYLDDASDGPATGGIRAAREVIWRRMRGVPLSVQRLQPAQFIHFGSTREYWRLLVASDDLARTCGWQRSTASWTAPGADSTAPVMVNSVVASAWQGLSEQVLLTDSELGCAGHSRGPCLIAGLRTDTALDVPSGVAVHQLPVHGGFVTRVYGLDDDPKHQCDAAAATIFGLPWHQWLEEAGLRAESVWPDVPAAQRTLWNARLYPVTDNRDESLELSLPLCAATGRSRQWRERWEDALRLSLAESFTLADGSALLADVAAIEDAVAVRRFLGAVEGEVPAAEARTLLGPPGSVTSRRSQMAGRVLAGADEILRLRGLKALAEATGSYIWEERAFRTLARLIADHTPDRAAAGNGGLAPGRLHSEGVVQVEAAARVDFGGGWTDTPPYSVERGGTVINAAVKLNGDYPIIVEGRWLDEPRLVLDSRDIDASLEPQTVAEVLAHTNPADPFALLKAATLLHGIVPAEAPPETPLRDVLGRRGLLLSTRTTIPRGSGLGTSSIMAGAVLACLARLTGSQSEQQALFDRVLCLEQMLTTGGGWQDQAGGLTGGIKLVTSEPGLPQRMHVAPVEMPDAIREDLSLRMVLLYTGQQRLAKNILRAVMGRWLARDREMVSILRDIAGLAIEMRGALAGGDLDRFGSLLSDHWTLNKRMDPGCTNPFIDDLFARVAPLISGGKLAGAGGGGFALLLARSTEAVPLLRELLATHYPGTSVAIWRCSVPEDGLRVSALP